MSGGFSYNRTFSSMYVAFRPIGYSRKQRVEIYRSRENSRFICSELKLEINYSLCSIERPERILFQHHDRFTSNKTNKSVCVIKFKIEVKFEWDRSPRSQRLNFIWDILSRAPFLIVNRIATITFSLRYRTFQSPPSRSASRRRTGVWYSDKRDRKVILQI